jgi:hypothetical protein
MHTHKYIIRTLSVAFIVSAAPSKLADLIHARTHTHTRHIHTRLHTYHIHTCIQCTYIHTTHTHTHTHPFNVTFIVPGITLLHAANSLITSKPTLPPLQPAHASTYSKGTRLKPWRILEFTYRSLIENRAHLRANAIFSCRRSTQPGNSLSIAPACAVTCQNMCVCVRE